MTKLAGGADLYGTRAAVTSDDIYSNFDMLLSMSDKVLHKLGPSPSAVNDNIGFSGNAEGSLAPRAHGSESWNAFGGDVFRQTPSAKTIGESSSGGCSFVHWMSPSYATPQIEADEPVFTFPHAVVVEESLQTDRVESQEVRERKGASQNRSTVVPGAKRKISWRSSSSLEGGEAPLESDTTVEGSTDRTWKPGTDLSPSSCEYLEESGTAASRCTNSSEGEIKENFFFGINESDLGTPRLLRSAGKGRKKRQVSRQGTSENQVTKRGIHRKSALRRSSSSVFVKSKQVRQLEVRGSEVLSGEVLDSGMPRTAMGKDKETFQAWKKPRRGGNGKSPSKVNDVEATDDARSQRRKSQENLKKPRGMKRTGMHEVPDDFHEFENQSPLRNEEGNTSVKELGNNKPMRNEVPVTAARTESVSPAVEGGIGVVRQGSAKRTPPEWKGREERRKEKHIDIEIESEEELFTQRPGKERARTPPSSPERRQESPPPADVVGSNRGGKGMPQNYHATDFEDIERHGGGRWAESSKKQRHRRRGDSDVSYDSDFAARMELRRGDCRPGGTRRRRGRSREGRVHRSRRQGRRGEIVSSEYDSGESSEFHRQRRRPALHEGAGGIRRWRQRKLEYSHSEESSGSTSEDGRYTDPDVEGKGVKGDLLSPKNESRKRQERRSRQGEREKERRNREKQGLKGHYITVNSVGVPYGFGVGAWKQELTKLCAALDPSITNIRYQPEEAMGILRRRLKDTFDYSAPVDRAHIRKLAGKFVTQRRSRILNSMKLGDECPSGLDRNVWKRLERIRQDPHREELSQRMKHANAARVNKGRTGPKGEDGIWEDLRMKLGREPDPEEVQFEMRRKKGYGGLSRKKKKKSEREQSPSSDGEDGVGMGGGRNAANIDSGRPTVQAEMSMPQSSLLRQMQKEMQELRAQLYAATANATPQTVADGGPCTSIGICGPESNTTLNPTHDRTTTGFDDEVTEEIGDKGQSRRPSTRQRKSRTSRKQ